MLPPFVPPSVRAPAETLPLITEFVIIPAERSFGATFATESGETAGVGRQTPIVGVPIAQAAQAFVTEPAAAPVAPSYPTATRTTPATGVYVAETPRTTPVYGVPMVEPVRPLPNADIPAAAASADMPRLTPAMPIPSMESLRMTPAVGVPIIETPKLDVPPVDQETQAMSSIGAVPGSTATPATPFAAAPASPSYDAPAQPTNEWVNEERDAFDWQSVAQLAPAVDEAQRADDEWTATNWDQTGESDAEHVSTVLVQLARRVRSGELKLETLRGATVEATLASVLAALLSDDENGTGRAASY